MPAEVDMDFVISDFYQLFTSFVKGKVPRRMLSNCELFYKCKACQEVLSSIQQYVEHFERCNLLNDDIENDCAKMITLTRTNDSESDSVSEKRIEKKGKVCPLGFKRKISENGRVYVQYEDDYCVALEDKHEDKIDYDNLRCLVCKKPLRTNFLLRQHLALVHLGYKKYRCRLCEFSANSMSECKKHTSVVHKSNCVTIFGFRKNFSQIKVYMPGIERRSRQYQTINNETETDEAIKDFVRPVKKRYATKETRTDRGYCISLKDAHEDKVDLENSLCRLCNKTLGDNFHLRQHLAVVHLGYDRFKCKSCEFKSSNMGKCGQHALLAHEIKATSVYGYKKYFYRLRCVLPRKNLDEKRKRKEKRDEPETDLHGMIAEDSNYKVVLNKNYEDIVDLKVNFCLKCSLKFQTSYQLRKHLAVTHLGFARYKCKMCEFVANVARECKTHLKEEHDIECLNDFRKNFHIIKASMPGSKPPKKLSAVPE